MGRFINDKLNSLLKSFTGSYPSRELNFVWNKKGKWLLLKKAIKEGKRYKTKREEVEKIISDYIRCEGAIRTLNKEIWKFGIVG
jgi:hypothetical protein